MDSSLSISDLASESGLTYMTFLAQRKCDLRKEMADAAKAARSAAVMQKLGGDALMDSEQEDRKSSMDATTPMAFKPVRMKLLQFHDNRRPAYYGTWRRHSAFVGPRRPHAQDVQILDYEVDSDDEWEEKGAEDGESLKSDDEDEDDEEFGEGNLSDEEDSVRFPFFFFFFFWPRRVKRTFSNF
jgi:hypothetical protein